MGAIYGNSNHPVEVKKIKLQIWSLREEIKHVLGEYLTPENKQDLIHQLELEYEERPLQLAPEITVQQEGSGPEASSEDGESEEASSEENEGEEAEAEAETGDESPEEELASVTPLNKGGGSQTLAIRRPNLDPDKISHGVTFLADITMLDICFFSSLPFVSGQTIVIDFVIPNRFAVTAQVLRCTQYNFRSRIISNERPSYRVHAQYSFLRVGERTVLRDFVKSIEPSLPKEVAAKPKVQEEESDDDGLGDLDDLGL